MPGGMVARGKAGLGSHILKLAVAEIPEEQDLIVEGHGKVVEVVAVVVANGAGDGMPRSFQA